MKVPKRHMQIRKDIVDKFEEIYPRCKEIFIARVLYLALQDKDFFDKIYFNPVFIEVK